MFYYGGLLAIYAFLSFTKSNIVNKNNRQAIIFFMLLPMFILTAFRAISVGTDTIQYARIYETINIESFQQMIKISYMEPGFLLLIKLFRTLGFTYIQFQIVINIFLFLLIAFFIYKYSTNIYLSCFLFLGLRIMFSSMNIVRSFIAISLLLLSVEFIKKRRGMLFLFTVIIACMFHASAAVFSLLYLLADKKITLKRIIVYVGIASILSIFGMNFFSFFTNLIGRYQGFISRYDNSGNIAVFFNLAISLCFFVLIYYSKISKTKEIVYGKNMTHSTPVSVEMIYGMASLLVVFFSILSLGNTMFDRIIPYFQIFTILSVPRSLRMLTKQNRFMIQSAIIIGVSIYFFVVLITRPDWNQVLPYKFFWNN